MKAKTLILAFALLPIFASAMNLPPQGPDKSPSEELRTKVTKLIGTPDFRSVPEFERSASIKFIVTTENELLVLDVDTKHSRIENHVKTSINYKDLEVDGVKKMQPYQIDVKFEN